jgi:enoyl-CoA hydratase/carnithine racemase
MSAELITTRRDSNLILTLSNPSVNNRLEPDMIIAAIEVISTAERDESLRTVILTGAGGHFCGGDRLFAGANSGETLDNLHTLVESIRDCPLPVIAAVEGLAAGAGLSLALACDMLVACPNTQFMVASGIPAPHGGASWFLAQSLPRQLAIEMLIEGTPISGKRLHGMGLVNRLADEGTALDAALAWAEDLARVAPEAVERVKALLREAPGKTLKQHFTMEKYNAIDNPQRRGPAHG